MWSFSLFTSGLSIDFDTEQLYWINSVNSTINRCKLDGSGLEVIEGVKLTKATALAIMGEEASASYAQISEYRGILTILGVIR